MLLRAVIAAFPAMHILSAVDSSGDHQSTAMNSASATLPAPEEACQNALELLQNVLGAMSS